MVRVSTQLRSEDLLAGCSLMLGFGTDERAEEVLTLDGLG